MDIVCADRGNDDETEESVIAAGTRYHKIKTDTAYPDVPSMMVHETVRVFGKVENLVNSIETTHRDFHS